MSYDNDDTEGCIFGVVILLVVALCAWMIWDSLHPSPEQVAKQQASEQRAAEDKEMQEWARELQLRQMRADKAKLEEAK